MCKICGVESENILCAKCAEPLTKESAIEAGKELESALKHSVHRWKQMSYMTKKELFASGYVFIGMMHRTTINSNYCSVCEYVLTLTNSNKCSSCILYTGKWCISKLVFRDFLSAVDTDKQEKIGLKIVSVIESKI